jgi:tetratricopeptide (TPR) repeat protein
VGEGHPSLETLARWLAGELEHEDVLREVAPHLTGSCSICRLNEEEIRRLQEESGHWSETVAVFETRQAPDLARLLEGRPHDEQMRLAEENEDLHTWGLCQYLLRQTKEAVFENPTKAVETAHLAVRVAASLGDAYHPGWVFDLQARAFAYLGNALRVLGELKAADLAFLRAEECLERSGTGNSRCEAEVLGLQSSLRLDQRRLEEALDLVDRAMTLHRTAGCRSDVARDLLQRAKILNEMASTDQSLEALNRAAREIDPALEPGLFAQIRFNQLAWLSLSGRYEEASGLLQEVRMLLQARSGTLDWLRLRWAEASIAQGLGRTDEAEVAYREVQGRFLEIRKSYDAALVSLDLAALLAGQGRTEELKVLAAEILPVFESREVHREAMASLLLFQQACTEERATLELIQQIAAALRRERRGNGGS